MADDDGQSNDDRTEDATPERREEFREKGQVAVSREVTSVAVLAASVAFLTAYAPSFMTQLRKLFINHFQNATTTTISPGNIMKYSADLAVDTLTLIVPAFLATYAAAIAVTLLQTRFNFSWHRVQPDFSRMNPLTGIVRLADMHALVELLKGVAKMICVSAVAYMVLYSEWIRVPGLMALSIPESWGYWGLITKNLFWGVALFLLAIAAMDYFYNFISLERKLRMTKKELKEDMKRREVDPHIRGKMRRLQREMSGKRMVDRTKQATVLITNPTHYSIALQYNLGMGAPKVVAKGQDFIALSMREAAKENGIPIVENKPLARTLYKMVEVDGDIPESLYKAVSEIIRYVFKLKGINYQRQTV